MTRVSTLAISGLCLAALLYFAASTPEPLTAPLTAFSPKSLPPYMAGAFCLLALAYSTWMLVVRQFYGKASLKQSNSCACVWSICVPAAAASSHHRRCC